MGEIAGRPIRSSETLQWVRSAFDTLDRNKHVRFVGADEQADLVLTVDLLKAYVRSVAGMGKSGNVVVRVHYAPQGGSEDVQLYRGLDTGVDWNASEGETEGVLNRALSQIVIDVGEGIMSDCRSAAATAH